MGVGRWGEGGVWVREPHVLAALTVGGVGNVAHPGLAASSTVPALL